MKWTIVRDKDRYPLSKIIYPDLLIVQGTLEQAENVAEALSNYYAGCDGMWFVLDTIND